MIDLEFYSFKNYEIRIWEGEAAKEKKSLDVKPISIDLIRFLFKPYFKYSYNFIF